MAHSANIPFLNRFGQAVYGFKLPYTVLQERNNELLNKFALSLKVVALGFTPKKSPHRWGQNTFRQRNGFSIVRLFLVFKDLEFKRADDPI